MNCLGSAFSYAQILFAFAISLLVVSENIINTLWSYGVLVAWYLQEQML